MVRRSAKVYYRNSRCMCFTISWESSLFLSEIGFISTLNFFITMGENWCPLFFESLEKRNYNKREMNTWDEKMILKKQNPPSLSSSFLGWNRCQESPHKFSKSGHCRILRKLHFSILKKRILKRLVKINCFRK